MPKLERGGPEARVRPRIRVGRLKEADLDAVLAIERVSFPTAWTRDNFLYELRDNRFARNLALRAEGALGGYASRPRWRSVPRTSWRVACTSATASGRPAAAPATTRTRGRTPCSWRRVSIGRCGPSVPPVSRARAYLL